MKRVRRKGGNKEKVFGCDLMEHLSNTCQEVPQVLRSCSEFIEEHGIVDGIYRLSGVSSNTQKLRSEFDSEGNPDLRKDVYLQDIHCVSSLCKAYFRELPNPLLTYQLYDRFAEAVAVQLEDERLLKIRDVLRDLPPPHFRTLEFLMRHLVKMSTFSAETNMHARNLAIVWAPNLLRSKDIEASGFNGTAAFMEVRVQSIVVEFILTHVPQLFPDTALGVPSERRKSLPSPTLLASQEEFSFRALPFQYPGNMSPGDGPPAMRPYHAIIEPTDKRKGSLKGRKWKSIFNLGGRLPDPRKRNKGSTKEKEKQVLRPAKSMDSLSPGPYEGNRQGASPTQLSPVTPTGQEGGASVGGGGTGLISGSYAVTYRRGGGASVSVVSGGGGTQGTYSRLESVGVASGGGSDTGGAGSAPVSRSPALSSRADKRAGIHISGPFSVTVPLHITSGLVGVIQGSRGEEESPAPAPAPAPAKEDAGEKRSGGREKEDTGEEHQEEAKGQSKDAKTEEVAQEQKTAEEEACEGDRKTGGQKEEEEEEEEEEEVESDGETAQCQEEVQAVPLSVEEKTESEERSVNGQLSSEEEDEEAQEDEEQEAELQAELEEVCESGEGDYVDMWSALQMVYPEGALAAACSAAPAVPVSAEEEAPDADLPLDFQDTFGFLDMMDSSTSQMNNEFSVEPPCFEEDEYENQSWFASNTQTASSPPQTAQSPLQIHTPAVAVLPQHTRLTSKSHSLPYKCSPSYPESPSSSGEEDEDEDEAILSGLSDGNEEEDEEDDEPGDYEQMFFRSLPNKREFHGLAWSGSGGEPLTANSSEDVCLSTQSEDAAQEAISPPASGHVDTSVASQSDQADPSLASSGVYANQSEGADAHDYVEMPVTSHDISDDRQMQSSPETDTSSLANQITDILPSSQSKCSYVRIDSNDDYMMMTRVRGEDTEGESKEEMDGKHSEDRKEEWGEKEASCEEGQITERQRASETGVLCKTDPGAEAGASSDQDSSPSAHTDYRPPLPIRDYHGDADDSQHIYEQVDVLEDEEDEEDGISDLTTTAGVTTPPHGETGTHAGDGSASEGQAGDGSASEGQATASCEMQEEGEQDAKYQKDGEEAEEMEEEKREDRREIESDREHGVKGERTKDEVDEDGDGEKEKESEESEERRGITEEEQEGNKPPVEGEEQEAEEGKLQPNGEERVVAAQKVAEDETTESGGSETEGAEEGTPVRVGGASSVRGQVGREKEGMREGHSEETLEHRDHLPNWPPEPQSDHWANEGRDVAEQLGDEGPREEEREQIDTKHKTVEGVEEGQWNVKEKRDREGKTDDKLIVLGPGVGSTLVTTKQVPPRTHQAKAVPVVPPKPQQSRLTALNLRQQLQNRDAHTQQRDQDTHTQQRDQDAPHGHTHSVETTTPQQDTHTPDTQTEQEDTHTPDTEAEQEDTHTPDTKAEQEDTCTPKTDAEMGQHFQTPDTKSAAQELTDTELRADTTHEPNPTAVHPAAPELYPPQIVIDQHHQSHMEDPEQRQPQPQHSNAPGQQTALPGSDGGAGMSVDGVRAREEGRGGTDTDTQEGQQRDRGAGGDRSPDVKKDRLATREGERERERRTRERDVKRNSGISICFDEAVARATREREREREHGEREKERDRGVNIQDEKARL
ncbi:hypothetical protein ACEWY4_006089 [Coilia grayii]|uniref:Rho-GAP domain-containing protein n=1 Tax=Coilia grayii TaxID=363190 RepID=A0ABD1KCI8_9TELE